MGVREEIRERAYDTLDQERWEQCVMGFFNVKDILLEKLDGREWNLTDILEFGEIFDYACAQTTDYVCDTMTDITKEVIGEIDYENRCNACMAGDVICQKVKKDKEDFHYNLFQMYTRYLTIKKYNKITDKDKEFINMCVERAKTSISQLDDLLEVARRWSDEL